MYSRYHCRKTVSLNFRNTKETTSKDLSTIDLPTINLSKVCLSDPARRQEERDRLMGSFTTVGFCLVTGLDGYDAEELLRWTRWFFRDVATEKKMDQLATRAFNPGNGNLYRGYFPVRHGGLSHKEGYDIGKPFPAEMVQAGNPFKEATPKLTLEGREEEVEEFYKVKLAPSIGGDFVYGISCYYPCLLYLPHSGDVQAPGDPGEGGGPNLLPDCRGRREEALLLQPPVREGPAPHAATDQVPEEDGADSEGGLPSRREK